MSFPIFAVIAGVCILILSAQFFWPLIQQTRVTTQGIEIRLLGFIPLIRMKFENITEVRTVTIKDYFTNREGAKWFPLGTRLFSKGVIVKRKSGFPRIVAIMPRKPEEFVAVVRAKLALNPT